MLEGSPERQLSERQNSVSIDELKRAFEFVEVSTPGISGLLVRCVISQLQKRLINEGSVELKFVIMVWQGQVTSYCCVLSLQVPVAGLA